MFMEKIDVAAARPIASPLAKAPHEQAPQPSVWAPLVGLLLLLALPLLALRLLGSLLLRDLGRLADAMRSAGQIVIEAYRPRR